MRRVTTCYLVVELVVFIDGAVLVRSSPTLRESSLTCQCYGTSTTTSPLTGVVPRCIPCIDLPDWYGYYSVQTL